MRNVSFMKVEMDGIASCKIDEVVSGGDFEKQKLILMLI